MRVNGFASRAEAGERLANRVVARGFVDAVVLALPRGGVPVALPVARALKAPLDLLLVRKIGVPGQKELAAAAIVDGERRDIVYNDEVMQALGLGRDQIEKAAAAEYEEIERRRRLYLKGRAPVTVEGRTVILVDDGIATGTTVKAALKALRRRSPRKLVLAVPVAPPDTIAELSSLVDEIICLEQPEYFVAIGNFYGEFHQLEDSEVTALMAMASAKS